jgi:DNA-binding HxlR family transcriptional regulator
MGCMAKRLRKRFPCPTEFTLAVLEGKWKSALLCCLTKRPCRYAELRCLLPGVSDKMLSSRLHSLVEQGIVVRQHSNGRPPVQTYSLSPLGYSLSEVLTDLSSWAGEHAAAFGVQLGTCPRQSPTALDSSPRMDPEAWPSCRTRCGCGTLERLPPHLPIGALMDGSSDRHTGTDR